MTYTQHFQLPVERGEKKQTGIIVSGNMFVVFRSKERTLAKQKTWNKGGGKRGGGGGVGGGRG